MTIEQRQDIERRIVTKVIEDALGAGYTIDVNDGEETVLRHASGANSILAVMFSTDEDVLFIREDGHRVGWVQFVYGNDGHDVIADHTENLTGLLAGASALADAAEAMAA